MTDSRDLGRSRYPFPGQMIDIGGRSIHFHSIGQGSPPVIMEAAIGDFSLTWYLVHAAVGQFTQSIVYDRAGLGWSDPGPDPRNGMAAVDDLRSLLGTIDIDSPYILVGHSYSGLLVRLFGFQYPEDVAGMVLVDSAHEDQFQRFPQPVQEASAPMMQAQLEYLRKFAEEITTQVPEAVPPIVPIPRNFPPAVAEMYGYLSVSDASRINTTISELISLEETQSQVRAVRRTGLGDILLYVLSHGQPQIVPGMPDDVNRAYEEVWQQMQAEISGLSTHAKRLVVEGSGHMIHHDRPQAVVDAIREIVMAIRNE